MHACRMRRVLKEGREKVRRHACFFALLAGGLFVVCCLLLLWVGEMTCKKLRLCAKVLQKDIRVYALIILSWLGFGISVLVDHFIRSSRSYRSFLNPLRHRSIG